MEEDEEKISVKKLESNLRKSINFHPNRTSNKKHVKNEFHIETED